MKTYTQFKRQLLKDKKVKQAYDALGPDGSFFISNSWIFNAECLRIFTLGVFIDIV